jgi:hypothetical protein
MTARSVLAAVALISLLTAGGGQATQAAERDWNDYQIIMWQPHSAAQDEALRRLGVTAGVVHAYHQENPARIVASELEPLLQNNLRWYVENIATDFYSAYHRWFPDRPVNWRFAAVKKLYDEEPSNIAALVRDPSLSDPMWLKNIHDRLANVVRAQRRYRPLYYNLADEPGIAELSVFWDFDFSAESLAGMRRWLQGQYGSLSALNAEWGSHFANWGSVMPMTTREAMRREDQNFSAWADFKAWMDVAFARAVRHGTDAVHSADPKARAAIEGAQISGWGGYDYSLLASAVDLAEVYDDGENLEALRSFNPGMVLLTTSGGGAEETHNVWRELLRGTRGLILWDPNSEIVREDGTPGPRGRAVAPLFAELRGGIGSLLINSQRHFDPIAILYSPASMRTQWMLDWQPKGDAWSARDANSDYEDPNAVRSSMNAYAALFEHLGLQPRFVTSDQVEKGELRRRGYRILILPRAIAVSPGEARGIRRFIAAGGVVIADGMPGAFDQHSRKSPKPLLSDVFGNVRLRLGAEFSYGRGQVIYLPPEAPDLANDSSATLATPAQFAELTAKSGVAPAFVVASPNGRPVVDVETYRFVNGGVTIVALLRDLPAPPSTDDGKATGAPTQEDIVLTLPRRSYVYDPRRGVALGSMRRVALSLDPNEPTILAVAERSLPTLKLSGPGRLRAGETGKFRFSLAGASPVAFDVFHVEVRDATGKLLPDYSENLLARDGKTVWHLPVTHNDAVGEWDVRVKDVLSGETARSRLVVTRP